jgi:hypothetical protein
MPQFLTSLVSWLTIAVILRLYVPCVQRGMAMERRNRFTRSAVLIRREDLQKRFSELQKLKEQVRLAEIAAEQSQPPKQRIACLSDGRR